MGEEQGITVVQVRLDRLGVQTALHGVWDEDHDQVGFGTRRGGVNNAKTLCFGLRAAAGTFGKPHADINTGIAQAQRVGMALRAVPEHGNLAPADDGKVSVCVIEELGHDVQISLLDVMKRNFGFG